MDQNQAFIDQKINHLFRHEYGKLVAVLTKTFGATNIGLAEDVVQEAMLEAIEQWAYKGVPDNAVGWIYQVAKYKAVNLVNRENHKKKYTSEIAQHLQSEWTVQPALNHIFTDQEIADDQLRMMFTCCHPAISSDSQVALTLKTLCGFSIQEIGKAFLASEENIHKRLVRARKNIREAQIPFEIPTGKELNKRLDAVLETIYLLFNEGYDASTGKDPIQYELCSEAIRLAEIIASNPAITKLSNVYALLALMSLNVSRFSSRIDEFDNILDLEHQDRTKWDRQLIQKGLYYLDFATQQNEVSIYHLLATISAHHCTAKDFESTNWEGILSLYDHFIRIDPSPIALLNRAVAIYKLKGAQEAIRELRKQPDKKAMQSYLPYYTTMAELYFQNKEVELALTHLHKALELPLKEKHKFIINRKIEDYSENK